MTQAAAYCVIETLRDGRSIVIRALKPEDRGAMLSAVGRVGAQSLYRRFFGAKRGFTEAEVDFFVNVDFIKHVALVAVVNDSGGKDIKDVIVGGGRFIATQAGTAELAFAVIDEYQGQGIGTLLLRHLIVIARKSGLQKLEAEVLPENAPMLAMFHKFGFATRRSGGAVHVTLNLNVT